MRRAARRSYAEISPIAVSVRLRRREVLKHRHRLIHDERETFQAHQFANVPARR